MINAFEITYPTYVFLISNIVSKQKPTLNGHSESGFAQSQGIERSPYDKP